MNGVWWTCRRRRVQSFRSRKLIRTIIDHTPWATQHGFYSISIKSTHTNLDFNAGEGDATARRQKAQAGS